MDLLKDDIRKLYKAYLVPSLSAAVVTSVYSFADMVAIGRGVGPDGAAALSIATPIFGVISFFGVLCGIGGSIHLSKARGEKRIEKSNAYFSASLLMTLVLTALVWVFFFGVFQTNLYFFWRYRAAYGSCGRIYGQNYMDNAVSYIFLLPCLYGTQ